MTGLAHAAREYYSWGIHSVNLKELVMKVGRFVVAIAGLACTSSVACGATLNVPAQFPTIQAAINAAANGDEVVVANGIYTSAGNKNLELLGKSITVRSANGPASCMIHCQNVGRAFYIHQGETAATVIQGFTIQSGHAVFGMPQGDQGGGMCVVNSHPTVTDCVFSGNIAGDAHSGYGGGLYMFSATATVSDCAFTGNSAYEGGGIASNGSGTLTLDGCTFELNIAGWFGGGFRGRAVANNCTFSNNHASFGGAFHTRGASTLTGCSFFSNTAEQGGGAMEFFFSLAESSVTNCHFENNSAWGGGAVQQYEYSFVSWSQCTFVNNFATTGYAGAINLYDTAASFSDCIFDGNEAPTGGGAFRSNYSDVFAGATFQSCSFLNNSSNGNGGAIYYSNFDAPLALVDCIFQGNSAATGGALHNLTDVIIYNCTFQGNSAPLATAIFNAVGATIECFGGSVEPDQQFVNQGSFHIGNGPAKPVGACILGSYVSSGANATIDFDLGGPTPREHDIVSLTGEAALAGRLDVTFNRYVPLAGDSFQIMSAANIASVFDTALFPPVPDGLFVSVYYDMNNPLQGAVETVTVVINNLNSIIGFSVLGGVPPGNLSNFSDVTVADFDSVNGDDIAITITSGPSTPGTVLVLLNDGTGQNFGATLYNVGIDPIAIVSAPLTDDTSFDLAVANRGSDTVTILANNGSGGFAPHGVPVPVGDQPVALAAVNVDSPSQAPGEIDLIVVNAAIAEVWIIKNDLFGFFPFLPIKFPTGTEPISIDPADVDLDRGPGLVDFVVANQTSQNVGVYRNVGGTFAPPAFFALGGEPVDVIATDLNGDGRDEIITTNRFIDNSPPTPDVPSTLALLKNNSNGSLAFSNASLIELGDDLKALTAVDLDFDGDPDLGVLQTTAGSSEIQVLRNDSDATGTTIVLTISTNDVVGSGAKTIVAGNIDSIAGVDLLAPNGDGALAGSATLGILINQTALLCPDIAPAGSGNGTVDVDDLLMIINNWGPCAACAFDIAPPGGDGTINVDDLLTVINAWGPCP